MTGAVAPSGDTTGAADTEALQAALGEAQRRSMDNPVLAAVERQRLGDTAFVQGFLDRGEPIPPGDYEIRGTLTFPADHRAIQPGVGLHGQGRSDTVISFREQQT